MFDFFVNVIAHVIFLVVGLALSSYLRTYFLSMLNRK